jgi:hydrogenase small subunit
MKDHPTVLEALQAQGISRRRFLKFCAVTASSLALSGEAARAFAQAVGNARRPSVIWLSFQQCTGCSESLLRSGNRSLTTLGTPAVSSGSVESLILDVISLDYHESLQVAAGNQAETARQTAMQQNFGRYVLIVDGSVPTGDKEWWMTVAGHSALQTLSEAVNGAAVVIALGTCATYGGLPAAYPNPSRAMGVGEMMHAGLIPAKTLVNLSGCPPVGEVITGALAMHITGDPRLLVLEDSEETRDWPDYMKRPKFFYGKTVHDTCPRLEHYLAGRMAKTHDDAGARQGWCLYMLGCRGPSTFNACSTVKWNDGQSFPMLSGHGCLGCSEPAFWDRTSNGDGTFNGGFYTAV